MDVYLQLENGKVFKGKSFGRVRDITIGELIFNTAMIGHEEIISDPTNAESVIAMSYPTIGNYGFNFSDMESKHPKTRAVICRNISKYPSNFRCEMDVDSYFKLYGIVGVEGIDTRELVKIIRKEGSMKIVISNKLITETQLKKLFENYSEEKLIYDLTCSANYIIDGSRDQISIIDFGIKASLLNYFKSKKYKINVYSANFKCENILKSNPKVVVLSNGPGNPYEYKEIIENIKGLVGKVPILSFGVGTDLLTLSMGGELKKLPFGHITTGASIRDLNSNKIYLTTQNHKYEITKIPEGAVTTFVNIEDKTIEGYKLEKSNVEALYFQPEGAPGPQETLYVIDNFLNEIMGGKKDA